MEEEKTKTPGDAAGSEREAPADAKYVAPGVPVVRTSTPRPGPFVIPAKTALPLDAAAIRRQAEQLREVAGPI